MSRLYRNRMEYIEALRTVLEAREDFKDLEYHRNSATQEEYLFLTDILGRVFYFDITGLRNEDVYHSMAQIECGVQPQCYIFDKKRMLEVARMFN